MLVKNLQKHGNSYAVVLDRNLMKMMGADPDTQFELTFLGPMKGVALRPLTASERHERIMAAADKITEKRAALLKKLAE